MVQNVLDFAKIGVHCTDFESLTTHNVEINRGIFFVRSSLVECADRLNITTTVLIQYMILKKVSPHYSSISSMSFVTKICIDS